MQDVQSRNRVELLFEIVESDDGAGSLQVLCAEAAESNDVFDARCLDGCGVRVADAVLVGAKVLDLHIGRNEQVDGVRILECGSHCFRVVDVAGEGFGAALGE